VVREKECSVDEIEGLADRLAEQITKGLGVRSAWALKAALDAGDADGVAGVIVFTIPAKCKDHVDVSFTIGTVDITTRWSA
jgi:hypothetical protein